MEFSNVPNLVGTVFWLRMIIIDLKEKESFLEQYIHLRNGYTELLLTSYVVISDTKEWLKRSDIEIKGIAQNGILLGVVILYLSKGGEIAFFVKDKNKGIGTKLLEIIEKVAKEKTLKSIWGWVLEDNIIAQRVFEKKGFVKEEITKREYNGIIKQGVKYKKCL